MIIFLSTTPALQRTMMFATLSLDAVNRAIEVSEYASGKNINAARVATTIGEESVATGLLGGDRGRLVRQELDRARIAHDFIEVDPPTRMCVTVIDRSANSATELVEEAAEVSPEDGDRLIGRLADLLDSADVLVLSGTLAPGVGDEFYARCVRLARRKDVPTILDARGEPLTLALPERPTVVKPNRSELAATIGADATLSMLQLRDAIGQMIERGAEWVVVTAGSRETVVSDGKAFHAIATPKVDVISPIGSGDALAAGLAAGICRGMDVPRACVLGVACGAANAMTALAGHVDAAEVARLQHRVCEASSS